MTWKGQGREQNEDKDQDEDTDKMTRARHGPEMRTRTLGEDKTRPGPR